MAKPITRRVRPALVIVALGAAAFLVPTTASATPDQPSAADVQRQLGKLALQNTQLVEKYDQAQMDVQIKQTAAQTAQQVAVHASQAFQAARVKLGYAAAAMYEGGSFSATGALLTSTSGASYLDQLQTLSMLSQHTAAIVSNLQDAKQQADTAKLTAAHLLATAQAKRNALAEKKAQVQKQIDKYRTLLDTLSAQQRAAFQQQMNPAVSQSTVSQLRSTKIQATSAAAEQAVRFALAQVGKPYQFGAAGPDAYDCSGLTMAAWASAGVSLPHSAAGQYDYGRHVTFDQLQPGDLMFFYQPIGHVTIYVGDGLMVSAPQDGENVSVVPANQFGSDFVGATRLTG